MMFRNLFYLIGGIIIIILIFSFSAIAQQEFAYNQKQLDKKLSQLEEIKDQILKAERSYSKIISEYGVTKENKQNKQDAYNRAKNSYTRASKNIDIVSSARLAELLEDYQSADRELKEADNQLKQAENKKNRLGKELDRLKTEKQQKEIELLEIKANMFDIKMREPIWVEGYGESILDEDKTMKECKKLALEYARRDAMEKGGKAVIESVTKVEMFQLVRDEVKMSAKVQIIEQDNSDDYGKVNKIISEAVIKFVAKVRLKVQSVNTYNPYRERIYELKDAGRSITLHVPPSQERPANSRLFVETQPEDARIRILNIGPRFYQGMELEPGRYHVQVAHEIYETNKQWVDLGASEDKYIDVRLRMLGAAEPAVPSGEAFTNSIGMKFVLIPAGTFTMGSPSNERYRSNDERQHRVTISKPFYMQTTEVTQGQWREVMGSNPSNFKNCGDNCPVENVSWNNVQSFIRKLNQKERTKKFRLPTEAEWEYACRAGTETPFYFGDCLSTDQANYHGNYPMPGCAKGEYRKRTLPVGSFQPNAWGLYDMHGNVWERCQDWYGDYPSGHVTDPTGPSSAQRKVLRGGSWYDDAGLTRSALRGKGTPDLRNHHLGFRVARTF